MDTITFRKTESGEYASEEAMLRRAGERYVRSPGTVGRALGDIARNFVVRKTKELHFSTPGRTYEECDKEVCSRYPHIAALVKAPIAENDQHFMRALGIEILERQE